MIYNGTLNEIPFTDSKKVGNCRLYIVLFVVFLVTSTVISSGFTGIQKNYKFLLLI